MLFYKTKSYILRKILPRVPQGNILVKRQQINLKDWDIWNSLILGGNIAKPLDGWEMAKRIRSNCKIFVKTFSGAMVSCMDDYMKPSLINLLHHFTLHVGTNDLSYEKSSMEIAESIINLTCRLKNEMHKVSVLTIILRTDEKKLKKKGMETNLHLKELSTEKNIFLIDNSRKIRTQQLNKCKLHSNKYGSRVLSNNFVNKISNVLRWQTDRGNSNANVEECNFKDDLTAKKYDECNISLKTCLLTCKILKH